MMRSIEWYYNFLAESIGALGKTKNLSFWSYQAYLNAVAELLDLQIFIREGPSQIISQIREIRVQLETLCGLPVLESTFMQRLHNELTGHLLYLIATKDSWLELMMDLDSEDGAL